MIEGKKEKRENRHYLLDTSHNGNKAENPKVKTKQKHITLVRYKSRIVKQLNCCFNQ